MATQLDGTLGGFYYGLRIVASIATAIHLFALIKIGLVYRKLLNEMKE
jgi:hypothetical protein